MCKCIRRCNVRELVSRPAAVALATWQRHGAAVSELKVNAEEAMFQTLHIYTQTQHKSKHTHTHTYAGAPLPLLFICSCDICI